MHKAFTLETSLIVAALLAWPLTQAATMTQADYKFAAEKCDALAGDAKGTCVAAAQSQFGKT